MSDKIKATDIVGFYNKVFKNRYCRYADPVNNSGHYQDALAELIIGNLYNEFPSGGQEISLTKGNKTFELGRTKQMDLLFLKFEYDNQTYQVEIVRPYDMVHAPDVKPREEGLNVTLLKKEAKNGS
jgi:hypothetical protein